jgi:hypothetical protein
MRVDFGSGPDTGNHLLTLVKEAFMHERTLPIVRMRIVSVLPLIMISICVSRLGAQESGVTHVETTGKRIISDVEMLGGDGTRLCHYAYADQLLDKVQIEYKVGELELLSRNDGVLPVIWDHPLKRHMITPFMPVYLYNSCELQNEITSMPFVPEKGDTLRYFHILGLDFPVRGDANAGVPDTAEIALADTLSYYLQIVDEAEGRSVATLDHIVIPPAHCFAELVSVLIDPILESNFEKSGVGEWIPGEEHWGRQMRLRVLPVYHPQRDGRFGNRALYCRYRWEDRASRVAQEIDSWLEHDVNAVIDSIYGMRKTAVSAGKRALQLEMSPTLLRSGMETLELGFPRQAIGSGSVSLFTSNGQLVHTQPLYSDSPIDRLAIKLSQSELATGAYLAVVRIENQTAVRFIRVLR